jgi:EAL domain-containing protein (putative c-di-GMP-specific phosphodiesterase class I)
VREAGLDPRGLMVELTEGTVMENPAAARGLIMQLRVMGIRVGLDDFGTGHSALAYLHQFPADFLKVDRSFMRGVDVREDMANIVRTVSDLADQLGMEVIAEGIEREEQLSVVRSLRCGYVQGFLFARPVDHEQTLALLQAGLELPLRRPPTGR